MRPDGGWRTTAAALLGVALTLAGDGSAKRAPGPAEGGPVIRMKPIQEGSTSAVFEVHGLQRKALETLAQSTWKEDDWKAFLAVYVAKGTAPDLRKQPAILGTHRVAKDVVVFEPRFPLERGMKHVVLCDPSRLPGHESDKSFTTEFLLEKPPSKATTIVQQVYPTRNVLPANQLKFYIHFSAPMQRGDVYDHVRLLDASGKEIEGAFLRLGEELWDPAGQRFTLFFDPGRVKRGLQPREIAGPILEEGKRYTFVIDRDWLDAEGNRLQAEFRKAFRVVANDEQPIDPRSWKIVTPRAASPQPLIVRLGKPLDHALLERAVWIRDPAGQRLAGKIAVSQEEAVWEFTPARPWAPGRYQLTAETVLEDLAGNRIGKPFEVDVFRKVDREIKSETVQFPFQIVPTRK